MVLSFQTPVRSLMTVFFVVGWSLIWLLELHMDSTFLHLFKTIFVFTCFYYKIHFLKNIFGSLASLDDIIES